MMSHQIHFWQKVEFSIVHTILCFTLVFMSMRLFLLGNGYPVIGTNFAGFSHTMAIVINFPLSYTLLEGFSASTTWIFQLPFAWPLIIIPNLLLSEKIFLLTVLGWYYFLSLKLSRLFFNTFSSEKTDYFLFSILFVLFMFLNYDFMFDFTGSLLPFLYSIPVILYILIKSYRIVRSLDTRRIDYVKVALAVSYISLGDPRFFILSSIALAALLVSAFLDRKAFIRVAKIFPYMTAIAAPVVLFMMAVYTLGRGSLNYVSGRPLTYSEISSFSFSSPLINYFNLTGIYWPAFIFSPPTILSYGKSKLDYLVATGYPPTTILTGGWLSTCWFLLTFFPFVMFLSPMISRKLFRQVKEHYIGAFLILALTIGAYFPFKSFVDAYISVGRLPLIGGIWSITFAIPNFFTSVFTAYVIFFASFSVLNLLERTNRESRKPPVRIVVGGYPIATR